MEDETEVRPFELYPETSFVPKRLIGRPSKYDERLCAQVIEYGMQGMSKAEIVLEIGIHHSTFALWQEKHPEFSAAVKEANTQAMGWWEKKGREATFGGSPGFNATSFIFNMKNRFKEDWRDKVENDQTLTATGPLADLLARIATGGTRLIDDGNDQP